MRGQRRDIQFLRGIAVLLVVVCHAFPRWLPYGVIGVDLFFVISGFLMTGMIASGLDRGDFTFAGFYLRRARRLLPASFVTVAVTVSIALFLLPAALWPSFTWQIVGAMTFTANFVSQAQIADPLYLQPLSHFWSLSLEEQFYLLFPLLLWVTPKKMRIPGLAIIALESFALMIIFGNSFHLLHRAWELLVGGLAYCVREKPLRSAVKWGAFLLVPISVAFDWIPLAVAATAVMLIGKDGWVRAPLIERTGDWSYSIYLIHWPLFSFAMIYFGAIPPILAGLLCIAAIGLAAAQYHYVEQPFRKPRARYDDAVALS